MDYFGQKFKNKRVRLDDNSFTDCVFEHCTLAHEGGPFDVHDGFTIRGKLDLELCGGDATIKLLDLVGRQLGYLEIAGRRYRAETRVGDEVA